MTFSKDDSMAIKGVAISLMLMHHNFFSVDNFKLYAVGFSPFSQSFIIQLSLFFKICVGIYVFISSYGLTLSFKNNKFSYTPYEIDKYIINRLISLLSGYWFIVVLSNIICQLIDGRTYSVYFNDGLKKGVISLIVNFFGLSELCGLNQLNGTWWYMSFAITIVFLVPFVQILYKKIGIILPLFLCILIPRVFDIGYNNMTNWVLAVLLGVIFAQYDLMVKLKNVTLIKSTKLNKVIKFLMSSFILVLCFLSYPQMPNEVKYNLIPIFAVYYCYDFIVDIKILRSVLIYLGKHSMNIFLIHTFLRYYYLSKFIYSFKHFIIINLVLLSASLLVSIIIEFLKKKTNYKCMIEKLRDSVIHSCDKLYNDYIIK